MSEPSRTAPLYSHSGFLLIQVVYNYRCELGNQRAGTGSSLWGWVLDLAILTVYFSFTDCLVYRKATASDFSSLTCTLQLHALDIEHSRSWLLLSAFPCVIILILPWPLILIQLTALTSSAPPLLSPLQTMIARSSSGWACCLRLAATWTVLFSGCQAPARKA